MTTGPPDATTALELRGITKRFGDVVALDGAGIRVGRGTVHALLGENGAGKSTLMRIAFGLVPPDSGAILLPGASCTRLTVREAVAAGLGMVHQHLSLAASLTAAENLELGGAGRYRPREAAERLLALARSSGLDVPLDMAVHELSLVQQQRLEILKALARDARVLILDEPTAVLAPAESRGLMAWVRAFASAGGSVVLVTHNLREALSAADEVTVLRRGRVTFAGAAGDCTEGSLARAVFPEGSAPVSPGAARPPGEVIVAADDLTVADARGVPRLQSGSFTVRRHEIVGVAAVEGAGHRELLAALAGLRPPRSGALRLPPRVVFVPADRQREGLIPLFTLTENVALHGIGRARGRMDWAGIEQRTRALIARFSITAPSPAAAARALSGGNQQRLVVARALAEPVDLVVADNPTRGLDGQATAFVHEQLRRAAADGAAVVVHSSDLDELLALATRMLVVFRGEVRESDVDRELVGNLMLGAA